MRIISTRLTWVFAIALVASSGHAHAGIVVSNLDQPVEGSAMVGTNFLGMPPKPHLYEYAQEFTTGSQSFALASIVASVGGAFQSFTPSAELVTDNNNSPGATVLTGFTFPAIGTSFSDLSFTPTASGLVLAADTSYWFVLAAPPAGGPIAGSFRWQSTDSNAAIGDGSIANTAMMEVPGSWSVFPATQPFLIEVDSAVPEPSSFILGGFAGLIGLGVLLGRRSRG